MCSRKQCVLLSLVAYRLPTIESFQRPGGTTVEVFRSRPTQSLQSTTRRYSVLPVLEDWKVLPNGRIEGKVSHHPNIEDGSIISTSPVSLKPDYATIPGGGNGVVVIETKSGSQYLLRNPSMGGAISGLNADYSADFSMVASTYTNNNNDYNNNNIDISNNNNNNINKDDIKNEVQKESTNETKKLMQKVKDAGVAGVISYAFWELGFWAVSVPVCIAAYQQVTGHWPDFSNQEDLKQLGAEAFAFVNLARFAVPLRIGLALSTTPWIQANIVDRFSSKDTKEEL